MERDSQPSNMSSLKQVMRFQPQSIKVMERVDKNLVSSQEMAQHSLVQICPLEGDDKCPHLVGLRVQMMLRPP